MGNPYNPGSVKYHNYEMHEKRLKGKTRCPNKAGANSALEGNRYTKIKGHTGGHAYSSAYP